MSISYQDNTKEVLEALNKAKMRGLKAIGMEAERAAKHIITEAPAVDTGRLRNSITHAISGESAAISQYKGDHGEEGGSYSGTAPEDKDVSVYIGTNVSYAPGIELGTRRRAGAVHFLKRAATENGKRFKQLLEDSMKNA